VRINRLDQQRIMRAMRNYSTPYRGALTAPGSRSFVAASSKYLSSTAAALTSASPYFGMTMACWFNCNGSTGTTQGLMSIGNTGSGIQIDRLTISSTPTLDFVFRDDASVLAAVTGSAPKYGVWQHACSIQANASKSVFLNGGGKTTTTTATGSVTWNLFTVGAVASAGANAYFDGYIGEAAIWNVVLSDAEILSLNTQIEIDGLRGYPPAFTVRPDALYAYWPLFGSSSPELDQTQGAHSLTLNAAPAQASLRPPVIYPPWMVWAAGS
jgi:hypothetical protein